MKTNHMPQSLHATHKSPRHGFEFDRVPTVRGSMFGGSIVRHYAESYGPILDCVFEMADDIASANGCTADAAVSQVLRDERWRLLPTHRAAIVARLVACA